MPLIITATDFSEVAENAINYACKLASLQNGQVQIIHSFIIPVMFSDIPMPGSLITDAQNDAEMQMDKLVGTMSAAYPGVNIKGKVIYGETADVIDDFTEESEYPWLVVVGNNGPTENSNWPDSTLMNVFKKLEYPVLAIPGGFTHRPVRRICFAFDNKHTGNESALQQIKDKTKLLNAELHVLTIKPHSAGTENNDDFDKTVTQTLAEINPTYHFVDSTGDIDQSIQEFIEKNNIDWLIMLPRKHSFFEGLFHKSHTKAIAHHSRVPILALHEND